MGRKKSNGAISICLQVSKKWKEEALVDSSEILGN